MYKLLIKIVLTLVLFTFSIYAVPSNAKQAMAGASSAGQFLGLIFYDTADASLTGISSTIATFNKSSTKKLSIYNAKLNDPANKDLAAVYGIQSGGDLPILLVVAPNGAITGGSPKNVTADQLKQYTSISELMLKTIKPLQEQKIALVSLQNASTKFNTESWAGVNDLATDTNYKNLVTAIKADPSAAGSQEFVKQCGLMPSLTEATVVVLLPPGKIAKVLNGKITKDDILKSLQSCKTGSGCCSDRRFKQNITTIASALDKVIKLQGVTFVWDRASFPDRNFPEGKEIGLIAQEVEPIVPEVVQTDAEGYKSVSYDKLTALLIEAVKEMKLKIDTQDSLIQVQNARINVLEGKKP